MREGVGWGGVGVTVPWGGGGLATRSFAVCALIGRLNQTKRPYSRNMPRAFWWSLGRGTVSYERGTPVCHLGTNKGLKSLFRNVESEHAAAERGGNNVKGILSNLRWLKPRPESSLDWLICSKFAGPRGKSETSALTTCWSESTPSSR